MKRFTRRIFSTATLAALATAVLSPLAALGAWTKEYFRRGQFAAIQAELTGGQPIYTSDLIHIEAPDSISDGASIRVVVTCDLPDVHSVCLLIKDNPRPLCCRATFSTFSSPYFGTSVRMLRSSVLVALVKTSSGFFTQEKPISVTIGGCD